MKKQLKVRRWATDTEGSFVSWRALMSERSLDLVAYHNEMVRRALLPGTIEKRMSVLVRCEMVIGHPLITATTTELRDWLDAHNLHARTRYSYISHLASFWRWALTDERVTANPTLRLTRPKLRPGLPRPISTQDLAILIEQAPDAQMRAMVVLGGYAGLRCMEIAGLDASDVMEHLTPPVLVVSHGKGDRPRVIPVPSTVIDALHAYHIPAYGPVFSDVNGDPLPAWKVSHMLRNHIHNCGVVASAHQLRHAFGTEVYRRSGDLRLTQGLMGHSSPLTTSTYVAWCQDREASIIAALFT